MSMIPQRQYDIVEKHLMERQRLSALRKRVAEARANAYAIGGKKLDKTPVKSSRSGDAMERKVQAIIDAEQALTDAIAWESVFEKVDAVLPNGTPEGEVAHMLYVEHATQADICAALGIDRQTVRRRKDTYIGHCAIMAAMAGLFREEDE